MSASASLIVPLTLESPAQSFDARKILESAPGSTDLIIDQTTGTATFGLEFPGNIDAIMRPLRKRGLTRTDTVRVAVPVKNLTGRVVDPTELIAHLNASPALSGVGFDGETVTATAVAATNAFRYLYEEIIVAGLMPMDVPTVAGPKDYVL